MADVVFVAIMVAFFALSVGLVHLCGRIIGPEITAVDIPQEDEPLEAAA
jgi:hypothetical protein